MTFSSKRSFLFKNNMTDDVRNQGYRLIVSNKAKLSSIRLTAYKTQVIINTQYSL